jgi:hypothetical protein
MKSTRFKSKSKVWIYPGKAAWHFVNLDKKQSQTIKRLFGGLSGGFGSLPVTVTLGKTKWKTSIFPDSKSGTYLLPLKSKVRKTENVTAGETIKFEIEIMV